MSKKMLLGVPGKMVEIPCPDSGMGFDSNNDTETTELISGGRSIWTAPTTFDTFNMSWKGGFHNLQPLINLYKKMYGPGPFYMIDPRVVNGNLLPARWAHSYQLGYVANGWCRPSIQRQSLTPEGLEVKFSHATNVYGGQVTNQVNLFLPRVPGKPLYFTAWGEATGTAMIRTTYRQGIESFAGPDVIPTTSGTTVQLLNEYDTSTDGVRLSLYLLPGSTLTLRHMDAGTTNFSEIAGIVARNLVPNSSMEGSFGQIEISRNLAVNPSFKVNTSSAASSTASSIGHDSSVGRESLGSLKVTATATGTYRARVAGSIPVVAGKTYTFTAYVRTSASSRSVTASVDWNGAAGYINLINSSAFTVGNTDWTRLTVTGTAVANTTNCHLFILVQNGTAVGETIHVDDVMIEEGLVANPYYDGDMFPLGDFEFVWAGAPYGSETIKRAASLGTNVARDGRKAWRSNDWKNSGAASAAVLAMQPNVDSFAQIAPIITNPTDLAGRTFTILATLKTTETLPASRDARYWSVNWSINRSSGGPQVIALRPTETVAGVYHLRQTVKIDNNALGTSYFRLYNGSSTQGNLVYWDDVMVVEGEYDGPYFDGDSPSTSTRYFAWDGPANTSTSVMTTEPYTPWRPGEGIGAWQFSGGLSGTLTSSVIDRIGLSVDITEVHEDPNYA